MLITGEQEGEIQDQEVFHEVAERSGGGDGDVQGAHLEIFNVGTLVTELSGGEDVDLHGTVGFLIDEFGKLLETEMIRMGIRAGMGCTEGNDIRRGSGGSGGCGKSQDHDDTETQREKSFHNGFLLV
jgi:hypothetical protein